MTVNTEDINKEDIVEEEIKEAEAWQEATDSAEETSAEDSKDNEGEKEVNEESNEVSEEEQAKAQDQEEADRKYMRLMADFQNYKRRVEKEKKDLYSYANEKIMSELLEVMDNFERALEQNANAAGNGGAGLMEGMEMIFKQLSGVLEKEGLKEIPALGEEFDPNVHNAVMTEETEEYESGKVSGVMQKGYTLNGKVIRPSMVKVVS